MRRHALAVFTFLAAASPAFAYQYAMWIPGWGSAQLNSIQLNAGSLTESNPVWYGWNSDGTLRKKTNAEDPTWRAAMTGTLIIPTVQNTTANGFDKAAVSTMLSSAANREAHANLIVQLVVAQAYDGIDIDYENIAATDKANFTAFLTTLAGKLHAIGKKLSVSVYGKASASATWDGPGGEDYPAIGSVADSVKIMAYDYHYSTSAAGPITPLAWLDQVATYAEATIPAKKIMFGMPFYGYDWSGTTGTPVTYAQAVATATANGATITHDADGEATYTYAGRTVYFQDAISYQKKVDLLKQKHPAIGGFTAWAAGQEDPDVWKVIRGESLGTAPAPADFAVSGPSVLTVMHTRPATATFSLVAINGFSSTANVAVDASGFSGTVTPSSSTVSANAPVTLTIVSGDAFPGTYPLTVRFTSGSTVRTQSLTVSVVAAVEGGSAPSRRRTVGH
jgi:spore germination protein YaaH